MKEMMFILLGIVGIISAKELDPQVNLTWIFECNSTIGYTHMPTIEWIATSNTIVAAWQATKKDEGTNDQHIMFSYSTDLGKKWTVPQTIAYHHHESALL